MNILRATQFIFQGSKHFGVSGFGKHRDSWDAATRAATTASLTGYSILITGANQGLGYQTALDLASRGATVLMVCRNQAAGAEARDKIAEHTKNPNVFLHVCDVSSPSSVRQLVSDIVASKTPVNCLVNNAGVMVQGPKAVTKEGLDVNFATNTLGTYLLSRLLSPWLAENQHPARASRCIFVTSGGMLTEPLVIDGMETPQADAMKQYARDKRRQVAMSEHFAAGARASGSKVHYYSVHPGWTTTEGVKKSIPGFFKSFGSEFRELADGADGIVYLCMEDAARLEEAGFYLDRIPQQKHLGLGLTGYTPEKAAALCARLDEIAARFV